MTRFRVMILTVVALGQLPMVTAVAYLSRSAPLALALACALTGPYLVGLRSPFDDRPKSRGHLLLLWPFFAWWTAGIVLYVFGPLALLLARLSGVPAPRAMAAAVIVALVSGARATMRRPRLVKRDVAIPGLPEPLDGYRIAHLTDVHCGSFTSPARVASFVARLNALDPDLVAVTGDLITSGSGFVDAVAGALSALRARDGVFACMGNHDYFGDAEELVQKLEAGGLCVLRNRGVPVAAAGTTLFVAGVDDTWTRRADVERALAERPEGTPALLLAHDPELFPEAAEHGVELVLSGHTHGGQLAIPGLVRRFNLARLMTRFSSGFYKLASSTLYVSRGAGTTGPPVRLGATGELTLLTLRRLVKTSA